MTVWDLIRENFQTLFSFDSAHPLLFTQFYFWGFFALVFAVFSLFHSKPLLRTPTCFSSACSSTTRPAGSSWCCCSS